MSVTSSSSSNSEGISFSWREFAYVFSIQFEEGERTQTPMIYDRYFPCGNVTVRIAVPRSRSWSKRTTTVQPIHHIKNRWSQNVGSGIRHSRLTVVIQRWTWRYGIGTTIHLSPSPPVFAFIVNPHLTTTRIGWAWNSGLCQVYRHCEYQHHFDQQSLFLHPVRRDNQIRTPPFPKSK